MSPATSYAINDSLHATSDPRFDMRLTEKFDDGEATSVGWSWVAATLIAGSLIVSGYLDDESANPSRPAAKVQKYAANTATAPSTAMSTKSADVGRDKGY